MANFDLKYGVVKVLYGEYQGRIGYYDDDNEVGYEVSGLVYFGSLEFAGTQDFIPLSFLAPAMTPDLLARKLEITKLIGYRIQRVSNFERTSMLEELLLIEEELSNRVMLSRFSSTNAGKSIFISHSSKDKPFAEWLALELVSAGHSPWLDEWRIRVGESIPLKISDGIQRCDALVVILSQHAVESKWVENEWQAKYWDEIKDERVRVLPILLKPCEIPSLLRPKKYADFTDDYGKGLRDLLIGLLDE
jgi:hypothetical protein